MVPNTRRRVYISVQFREGCWCCRFLDKDLPRSSSLATLNLPTAEKLIALVGRGDGLSNQANRDALSAAILNGTGQIFVDLTDLPAGKGRKTAGKRLIGDELSLPGWE